MDSELRPIPPNKLTHFANMLRKAKDFGNNLQVNFRGEPVIGGGDMLFGEAPEALEQWSYGNPPWTGRGQTLTLKPEAVDIAAIPTFGAVTAAATVGKRAPRALAKTLGKAAPEAPSNVGRRDFLKKSGAAAGVAAAAAVAPSTLLKTLGKGTARVADNLLPKFSKAIDTKFRTALEESVAHLKPNIYASDEYQRILDVAKKAMNSDDIKKLLSNEHYQVEDMEKQLIKYFDPEDSPEDIARALDRTFDTDLESRIVHDPGNTKFIKHLEGNEEFKNLNSQYYRLMREAEPTEELFNKIENLPGRQEALEKLSGLTEKEMYRLYALDEIPPSLTLKDLEMLNDVDFLMNPNFRNVTEGYMGGWNPWDMVDDYIWKANAKTPEFDIR